MLHKINFYRISNVFLVSFFHCVTNAIIDIKESYLLRHTNTIGNRYCAICAENVKILWQSINLHNAPFLIF